MGPPELIRVRVVYALPQRQCVVEVHVRTGASVADAVAKSGIVEQFSGAADQPLDYAIFGRVVTADEAPRDGDRIEVLRPLIADPKQKRRQAAARGAGFKPGRR